MTEQSRVYPARGAALLAVERPPASPKTAPMLLS